MKKVFFDLMVCQPMGSSKFHGGGEYTKTVFRELCEKYLDSVELSVFYDPNKFIDEWIKEIIKEKSISCYLVSSYDEVSLIPQFQAADTLFAGLLTGIGTIKTPSQMHVVAVYHGFRWLEKPVDKTAPIYETTLKRKIIEFVKLVFKDRYFEYKREQIGKKISCCTDIVGVSEHSKYSAKVFFPDFDQEHIHVFYSPEKYVDCVPEIPEVCEEKYILMLGGDRCIKNVYRGILALEGLFDKEMLEGYTIHIVGGLPQNIRKKIKHLMKYKILGYLTPEELELEYAGCDFFFYPSLNEGFGYPPQEVMKYGKTCLISAVSSLPEIYKDSVYYCNPYDLTEMRARLLQASDCKIDKKVIEEACERISNKQKEDLKELCLLITQG